MASVVNDPNGRKRILFIGRDATRKAIRLGKLSVKQAEAFKVKVEQLVSASITGSLEDETARWLVGLGDVLHARGLPRLPLLPPVKALNSGHGWISTWPAGES